MVRLAGEAHKHLDPALVALLDLRVSQLNGCAYCLALHSDQAREAGVEQRRLDTLPAWRESPLFTPAERAALAFAEAVTLPGPHGVADDVYAAAAEHFDDAGLTGLLMTVVAMNGWNRIAIATGMAERLAA
jgi:AhpD family alkylhydroperoxidase